MRYLLVPLLACGADALPSRAETGPGPEFGSRAFQAAVPAPAPVPLDGPERQVGDGIAAGKAA